MMSGNSEIPDNIKNILNSMNSTNSNSNTDEKKSSNVENFDMNTFIKMQKIMSSMNDTQNDSRTNLLMSLKPYLKESRKNKVDQYIQLMRMGKVFEIMNPLGGDHKHV